MREGSTMLGSSGPDTASQPKRLCGRCNPGIYRRVNRITLLERTLFTWLGFFPWECVSCRRKNFFRTQGRKS